MFSEREYEHRTGQPGQFECKSHFYRGFLPCPWPKCPRGADSETVELVYQPLRKEEPALRTVFRAANPKEAAEE